MQHRTGSVYIAVLGVISVVTVLALAGVASRKSMNERARLGADAGEARILAQSAAELAIQEFVDDPDQFKVDAATGTLFTSMPLGSGTLAATVTDIGTGTTPTDSTTAYRVVADATTSEARSRLSFDISIPENPYVTLLQGLGAVAYWPLDEAAGASVADDPIGGYDGTYNDPSKAGGETHEHGNLAPENAWTSHRTEVSHDAAFEANEGTLSFWGYWDSLPTMGGRRGGVCKEQNSKNGSAYLSVYLEAGDKLIFSLDDADNDGTAIEAIGAVDAATWHHITVTWGDRLEIYVDGSRLAQSSKLTIGLGAGSNTDANTAPWMFGVRNVRVFFTQPAYPAYGSIARVVLFDKVLPPADIMDLHETSTAPGTPEIVPGSFARVVD